VSLLTEESRDVFVRLIANAPYASVRLSAKDLPVPLLSPVSAR